MPRLRALPGSYRSVDLESTLADDTADIESLPYADRSYDLVVCNHVLEHVTDDRAAMAELRRVLDHGGMAVLQHPVVDEPHTVEDPSVTSPAERLRRFGQDDHLRVYGWDILDRLKSSGFSEARNVPVAELAPGVDWDRLGLIETVTILARA